MMFLCFPMLESVWWPTRPTHANQISAKSAKLFPKTIHVRQVFGHTLVNPRMFRANSTSIKQKIGQFPTNNLGNFDQHSGGIKEHFSECIEQKSDKFPTNEYDT